ncbi:MAG TPA: glycosyltransferase [Ferrovibrio sp.]|uniref:glycosyltransferase n=1 Tax=Ferrovibrio sp. TaxID=1917215 RepID=UPI002ED55DA5
MTIRILHLITDLEVGGAERMLERLILGMDRAQFENIVVSLTDQGPIGRHLLQAGIPVHALRMRGVTSLPRAMRDLHRLLQRKQPDILQTWLYHADLVGTLVQIFADTKARLIWNLRCSDMQLGNYALSTRLTLMAVAALSRRPAAIITNSEAGRRHHAGLGYRPPRWELIPNGFDLDAFRPQPQAGGAFRAALGLPPEAKLIGMIARFDPVKDHATFLAMAERLAPQVPAAHFLLIGRGCDPATPLFAAAAQRLAGRLHLLGERGDVQQLLPGLDLCVLSSASEGFPNVLGEALACGVPCLATDVGDAALVLGDCGTIVPPRDPAALAKAAGEILGWSAEHRAQMQRRARHRAERHFSLPVAVERYEMLYREMSSAAPAEKG